MIKYFEDLVQGSEAWLAARCGLLTASEMKYIITPAKFEYAKNDKEKKHLYELVAQTINKYVEPSYVGDDMLRGHGDELEAKIIYNDKYAPVRDMGFITNDKWGFTLGYSPDGLIGGNGQIECKSRKQCYQMQTILEGVVPDEYVIQVQTGLLVSECAWCDYISYSGGMPMFTFRIYPDKRIQDGIVSAATIFHDKMKRMIEMYEGKLADKELRLVTTERKIEKEITI